MECYWNRNTAATLAELRKASAGVAVIPLASIESHGPHLPLGSDTHCIEYLVRLVLQKETVAVLPTVQTSYVAAARSLPGAIHIRSDLLMDLVENICDEIHRNGFDKIVLLHGHGGNVFLGGAFVRRMLEREKPYAVYSIPVAPGVAEDIKALMETQHTGHACEFETSLNMVACPELVDLEALCERTFPTHSGPEVGDAVTPVDWISRHPEMAVGEPQKATREKGEQIAQLWSEAIVKHLQMIKRDEIVGRTMESYARRVHAIRSRRGQRLPGA
jgi:creatinine amidohydrolase